MVVAPSRLVLTLCLCSAAAQAQAATEPAQSPYYWERGEVRPFVSLAPALGAISSLEVAGGYGKPHWMWGGVEATALTSWEFGAVSAGPRLAFIVADLSLKRRQTWSYTHNFLPRLQAYDADDVEDGGDESAVYGAWDLSLNGLVPTPIGVGLYELAGTFVDGVPPNRDLLEEWQRVVVRGNSIVVARAGFAFWLIEDELSAGVLGEWLSAEGRGQTWRLGPLVDWAATDHLSLSAVYTVPISSPDDLGAWVGAWGTLRVRYAWASGEQQSRFP